MAQIINLDDRLNLDKPIIKIGDRNIKVDNGAKAYARYVAYQENTANRFKDQIDELKKEHKEASIDEIKEMVINNISNPFEEIMGILEIFISEEDAQFIYDLDLSIEDINVVINAIIAASKNMTLEEYETIIEEQKGKKKVN